ncbi:SGNH/GDSL hydrolase family protein [Kitasatospora purpeofusca]|uniref:SGNH/GDSL hydrolase family protein n=1 Tax=Kitasatospora purpeofusca TaxID=67352 RepID=UPI002252D870|nr:SGNH/GDSL hydrolase family protein [Kitasatospora purpeofusca]MCX4754608.1 SGNH/GDSL hydrolase family protein [Kitasatospora purpeofusca]WSR34016.1 SGNH/GDSL hydrolase family protein [Kitasatospora purpeofusca]
MPGTQQSRARVARRIATAAAYGGGGLGVLGVGLVGLLLTESKLAVQAIGILDGDPPRADGVYGEAFADSAAEPQPPLVLAFLGDSTAAGLGVLRARETPGALLAAGLASVAERPVRLANVAFSGGRSADLAGQLEQALACRPDIAVIMIGANDVTRHSPAQLAVRQLGETVAALRAAGCEVVVGTCPDLGTIKPVRPPLRWVARRVSRQLAAAQTIAVVEAGGRTVSLGSLLGPEFAARPEMFAADRYHPSAQGYATAAMAVLPSVCAALGLWPQEEPADGPVPGEAVLPVAVAAAAAADRAGSEVAAVGGGEDGAAGRWALLRHRLRVGLPGSWVAGEPVGGPSDRMAEGLSGGLPGSAGPLPGNTSASSHTGAGDD